MRKGMRSIISLRREEIYQDDAVSTGKRAKKCV